MGLDTDDCVKRMEYKRESSEKFVQFFKETSVQPKEANPILEGKGSEPMKQPDKMFKVFSRPQLEDNDILRFEKVGAYIKENSLDEEIISQAIIQVKYSGYIEKEKNNADKLT